MEFYCEEDREGRFFYEDWLEDKVEVFGGSCNVGMGWVFFFSSFLLFICYDWSPIYATVY